MKVAIVLNSSWNIINFRMGLVRALQKEGHEVIAVAPVDSWSERLKNEVCQFVPVKMDSRGANPVKDLLLIRELYEIYKRERPDIILHFTVKPNIYGTIAANFLRIPVINNVCGLGSSFLKKGLITGIVSFLYRLSFRFSSRVFFQNHEDCELFVENKLVRKDITDVLPGSGIDVTWFKPVKFKKDGPFTFLMVGRLIKDKGVLEYIEAIRKLKKERNDLKFKYLGAIDEKHLRGISRNSIDEWVGEGLLEYLGTADDVRKTIAGAHCIVLPSYREGTPRTLLEASGMAKPIVTTDAAGCNSVVEDGVNGLLCRPGSASDLANKLGQIADMSENELRQMGLRGRKKIELVYDEKFVVDKYLQAISEIKGTP